MNRLIFGKDDTKNIVNLTVKNDTLFLYTEDKDGVKEETFDFQPWGLSHKPVGKNSQKLKGDQYYKYLTSITTDKFNELSGKFNREHWFPRSIEECVTLFDGVTYYKGMKVNDVSILSFDIETSGLVMDKTSKVFLISNTYRRGTETFRKLFSIDDYADQNDMIDNWCYWVSEIDPSILTGHNILSYDLPYLNNIQKLKLGRDGSNAEFAEKTSKFRKDGSQQYDFHNVKITGREIIDTFFLSIKYDIGREFPSYGLKPIVKHLGLEKLDRTFIDASQIKNQWNDLAMREKIKQYTIEDSDDALKLFDLMIPAYFYLAQSIPKTLQQMVNEAAGSQLDALMIRSYLQNGYSQPRTSNKVPFEGAISMGIPGIYENVCKADVASLYPSIMLEYNIHDPKKDPENHIIQMLTYFRDERLRNKKLAKETGEQYYKDLDQSQKIVINSLYGFLGAGYLLYNYPEGGAEVTRRGREILLKGVEWATGHTLEKVVKAIANEGEDNEETSYEWVVGSRTGDGRGYTLVNVDTDSFSIINGTKLSRDGFAAELKELNSLYSTLIRWEDDGIYDKIIVVGAKNYVLVKSKEYLKENEKPVKFKGSALTDQKKEPALTEMLEKMIYALLDDERVALPVIYKSYIREAVNIQFINRWTVKKTVTKSVLDPNRLTEQKILDAINESIEKKIIEGVSEGDKVWLYNSVQGEIQKVAKGELVFYKDGRPKLIPNCVLKDVRLWNKDEDKLHYVSRVNSTVQILSKILNMDEYIDYTKKSNVELLKELTSG